MIDSEQCMRDIGCNAETAAEFKTGDVGKRIRILQKQRRALMDSVHKNQKRIDRVDYIINELERSNKE